MHPVCAIGRVSCLSMSRDAAPFVVVGGNLTAGAAGGTLREEGFDGPVVVIGAEPHPPYERPPLSKAYLRGESDARSTLLRPESWYEENEVELRLGTKAARIDPDAREVELEDGERIRYAKLLIATGGRNRRLNVPGADLEGVHELRTIEHADAIRAEAVHGGKAAV